MCVGGRGPMCQTSAAEVCQKHSDLIPASSDQTGTSLPSTAGCEPLFILGTNRHQRVKWGVWHMQNKMLCNLHWSKVWISDLEISALICLISVPFFLKTKHFKPFDTRNSSTETDESSQVCKNIVHWLNLNTCWICLIFFYENNPCQIFTSFTTTCTTFKGTPPRIPSQLPCVKCE